MPIGLPERLDVVDSDGRIADKGGLGPCGSDVGAAMAGGAPVR